MKNLKRTGKIIFCAGFLFIMLKACQLEYACDVVDGLPEEIVSACVAQVGTDPKAIAEYYAANKEDLWADYEFELEHKYGIVR